MLKTAPLKRARDPETNTPEDGCCICCCIIIRCLRFSKATGSSYSPVSIGIAGVCVLAKKPLIVKKVPQRSPGRHPPKLTRPFRNGTDAHGCHRATACQPVQTVAATSRAEVPLTLSREREKADQQLQGALKSRISRVLGASTVVLVGPRSAAGGDMPRSIRHYHRPSLRVFSDDRELQSA